jgi:L-alanine-DL-glutamate epimerase-like enolase superfamily enzyme
MGAEFLSRHLPQFLADFNAAQTADVRLPWLAALVCASAFDLALYDAYGVMRERPVFETLGRDSLSRDLSALLEPASESVSFAGKYPADFLRQRQVRLPVWHSVGAGDPLDAEDLTGDEPQDGLPLLLGDWIRRDGLFCLKVKLSGGDAEDDYRRLARIGAIGRPEGVRWLCADYNCTAPDVDYVTAILDRLLRDDPLTYAMLLYVEQPFPYDLEAHPLDVHAISARKPLFMDESAHDWKLLRLGRTLGWNGAALKTCKTLTEALLALCWARAHGMTLMVQDLTNPMLAMIPHAQLTAHAGTIMGLESNAPQYYPAASAPEAAVHPGVYRRRDGHLDLSTLSGPGFGYRIAEIRRALPEPVFVA